MPSREQPELGGYEAVETVATQSDRDGDDVVRLSVGDLSVAVRPFGSGARQLLTAHGLSGFSFDWQRTALALGEGWTVNAVDLRGFGRSDIDPSSRYSAAQMAADLIAVCEALRLERPLLAGHSFGGRACLIAAARRPDLFSALVLVDSGPEPGPGGPGVRTRIGTWPEEFADAEGLAVRYRQLYALEPEEFFRKRMGLYVQRTLAGLYRIARDPWWKEVWASGPAQGGTQWSEWERVQIPSLIIRGGDSQMLAADTARRMIDSNPRSECIEIPEVGHNVPMAAPEALAKAIGDFYERLPVGTAEEESVKP